MAQVENSAEKTVLVNFKAEPELRKAIENVALSRSLKSKTGDRVYAADILRDLCMADPDIRREYKRLKSKV